MLDSALLSPLRSKSLFRGADADVWDRLARESRVARLPADASVYREGDDCAATAILLHGQVRVFKSTPAGRELTLYRVEAGESCLLTTHCVLSQAPFCATAAVSQDAQALLVPANTFRDWFRSTEFWRGYVFQLMGARIGTLMELVQQVAFRRVDERLARVLLDRSADGVVRATHQELADEIGSSREVVSRVLEEFAYRGFLEMGRGKLGVTDVPGLRGFAAGATA